jgi:hypothetical protein
VELSETDQYLVVLHQVRGEVEKLSKTDCRCLGILSLGISKGDVLCDAVDPYAAHVIDSKASRRAMKASSG